MDSCVEQETHVVVSMSHRLIDDVKMYRKLIWIKPNIIVLIDEAMADATHSFEQNFILNKFKVNKKDQNRVSVHVGKGFDVLIRQFARRKSIELNVYKGNSSGEEESLRGARIRKGKEFERGLNLAFAQKGNMARFATVIECHSPDREGKPSELSVESLKIKDDSAVITLDDGSVITEKCSLENWNASQDPQGGISSLRSEKPAVRKTKGPSGEAESPATEEDHDAISPDDGSVNTDNCSSGDPTAHNDAKDVHPCPQNEKPAAGKTEGQPGEIGEASRKASVFGRLLGTLFRS